MEKMEKAKAVKMYNALKFFRCTEKVETLTSFQNINNILYSSGMMHPGDH